MPELSPESSPDAGSLKGVVPENFVAERELGRGSFGRTWLAHDAFSGESCVIKQLDLRHLDNWKSFELFEREARVLEQLDHPRIPRFLGFYNSEGKACLIQGYKPGRTLEQTVRAGKRFSEPEIVAMASELLGVLDYLQSFSPPVIHRDIKPANIILSAKGEASLVDFGAVNDTLLRSQGGSTVVGTFGYMPPEQLEGRAVPGSDLYALGASLIFALSGFEPGEMEKADMRIDFRPHVQISAGLAGWLDKMTDPDWKQRFGSAQEALEALHHREQFHVPIAHKSGYFRAPMLALAGLTVAASLLIGGWWLMRPQAALEGRLTGAVPGVSAPRFWIVDQTGQRHKPQVDYADGKFSIRGLPPGRYGLNIAFDSRTDNPLQYPGDLRAWSEFEIVQGKPLPRLELPLIEMMHLTSPIDNNQVLAGWGEPCSGDAELPAAPQFGWDSLSTAGGTVVYDYLITRQSCAAADPKGRTVASGSTGDTLIKPTLPPSAQGEYYRLRLEARSQETGAKIGRLRTYGPSDHDWDYTFRVR